MTYLLGILTGIALVFLFGFTIVYGTLWLTAWSYRRRQARIFKALDKCDICGASGTEIWCVPDLEEMRVRTIRLCGEHLQHELEWSGR